MPKYNQKLNDKHWEALRLLEEGRTKIKDIAAHCGWSAGYMYDLVEGKEKNGKIGELFTTELRKQDVVNSNKVKRLVKSNKSLAMSVVEGYLQEKAAKGTINDEEAKVVSTVINALGKMSPTVEVGSMQWNYTKGLTAEELVHEFNKLRSLAEGAPKRRGIPESGSRIPGEIFSAIEHGSGADEGSEAPELRADGEAEGTPLL